MSAGILNATQVKGFLATPKTSAIKRLVRHLVVKCQGISIDRQNLWRVYDEVSYTHNTPRSIWRRHGALLMYAVDQKHTDKNVGKGKYH